MINDYKEPIFAEVDFVFEGGYGSGEQFGYHYQLSLDRDKDSVGTYIDEDLLKTTFAEKIKYKLGVL